VIEARDRLGGRVYSSSFSAQGDLPAVGIDLGANYIHGAGFEGHRQPVFEKAIESKTMTALAPGRHWENTQVCQWFDHLSGREIPPREILKMHALASKVQGRLGKMALEDHKQRASPRSKLTEGSWRATIGDALEDALAYVVKTSGLKALSSTQRGIFDTVMVTIMSLLTATIFF